MAKPTRRRTFVIEHVPLREYPGRGRVFVTGTGDIGQLGLGPDVLEVSSFTEVPLEEDIIDIQTGPMHTVCLTKGGQVLTFGCNDEGALGRNTADEEDSEYTPAMVDLPGAAIQISAGDSHTIALLRDGRVFIWGTFRDLHGNMGLTPEGNKFKPYQIMAGHQVVDMASGGNHVTFITSKGVLYTCGCAEQGQLGRITERKSDRNARSGGPVKHLDNLLGPAPIHTKPYMRLQFVNVWAGEYATFAQVARSTDIYVCGLNNFNQLGIKGTNLQFLPKMSKDFSKQQWKCISNAEHHTLAVDIYGKCYAVGRKEYGRLGFDADALKLTCIPALEQEHISEVSCAGSSSLAINKRGEVFVWGMGTSGQLGTSYYEDCLVPTKIKQLADEKIVKASTGGQHTVLLGFKKV